MAPFGSMTLLAPESPPVSGGVFSVNRTSSRDASIAVDGQWTIEIRAGGQSVVARGGSSRSYNESLYESLGMAQTGLDLLSILGLGDRVIAEAENEHVVWWIEPSGVALRIHDNHDFGFRVNGTGTATDAAGNPMPPQPPRKYTWHESYRYFRLSQATDDLFDAYRNLFLALESILSTIEPVRNKPSGKGWETERDWLTRAIHTAASMVDLRRSVPAGIADPEGYLFKDLYEDKRTALFHAKKNRPVFLPHETSSDRESVTSSLTRLAHLYLDLIDSHLKIQRRGSSLSLSAFGNIARVFSGLAITDVKEEFMKGGDMISIEGKRVVPLACRWAAELDEPGIVNLLGSIDVSSLADIGDFTQVVLLDNDKNPAGVIRLKEPLSIDGIQRLEVQFSQRLRNNEPRGFYGT
jgi:hypothetical protein